MKQNNANPDRKKALLLNMRLLNTPHTEDSDEEFCSSWLKRTNAVLWLVTQRHKKWIYNLFSQNVFSNHKWHAKIIYKYIVLCCGGTMPVRISLTQNPAYVNKLKTEKKVKKSWIDTSELTRFSQHILPAITEISIDHS